MIEKKYLIDESKLSGGHAENIYFPTSIEDLADQVASSYKAKRLITISAARTGITGGAVPFGGDLISLEKMNSITGLGRDQEGYFLEVEPSVTLDEINEILIKKHFSGLKNLTPNAINELKQDADTYIYPVDPTETGASIGGTIAVNASGARSYKYGPTRNWIKKISVMLYTGELIEIERGQTFADQDGMLTIPSRENPLEFKIPDYYFPEVKNAAGLYTKPGMDLIDIFIGCEGILGIIAGAQIRLTKKHKDISVIQFFDDEEQMLDFIVSIRNDKDLDLEFLEFIDKKGLALIRDRQQHDPGCLEIPLLPEAKGGTVFFDIKMTDTTAAALDPIYTIIRDSGLDPSYNWVAATVKDRERLRKFRHFIPETVNEIIFQRKRQYPALHKLGTDMSVPDDYLKDIYHYYKKNLEEQNLTYVMFGHIGNNHIHVNILPENMDDLEKAKALYKTFAKHIVSQGGSISAEHGIGKIKREYIEIMYGADGVAEMQRIKTKLDPDNLINIGNVV